MPKEKISVTVEEDVIKAAYQLIDEGGAESMSAYVAQLIARDLAKKGRVKPGLAAPPDLTELTERVAALEKMVATLHKQCSTKKP